MILSAATSALNTVAALGYSLEVPDWLFDFLAFVLFFCVFIAGVRVSISYFKYLRSKPEA